ncbi:hypothetical protein ACXX9E_18695 [Pseudomonas sp. GNP014]
MSTDNKFAPKNQRLEYVKQVIRIIVDHGRLLFSSQAVNRLTCMEVDKWGNVRLIDNHSGVVTFIHDNVLGVGGAELAKSTSLKDLVREFQATSAR